MSEPTLERIEDVKPSLEDAQEKVGGYVELLTLSNGEQMLVDEEGLFKQSPQVNVPATFLAGRQIVGNAIILAGKARWN
jgi:hypothetical protein